MAIVALYLFKGVKPQVSGEARISAVLPGTLENQADVLAKDGDCGAASKLYVQVVESLNYTADSSVIGGVFRKYCDCQNRLGRLNNRLCVLKDSVKNITLARKI